MNNYFWKNDLVELKLLDDDIEVYLEKSLYDCETRKLLEKGIPFPVMKDTAAKMIQQAKSAYKEGEELWFSILNPKNEMVGYAVANCFDERMGNVQMYIVIFEEHRRKHYARNAAKILMDYLFLERHFHRIGCCMIENNPDAEQFAKRMGFTLEAFRSEMFYTQGKYLGESYYSLLSNEYESGQKENDRYERKEYHSYQVYDCNLGEHQGNIEYASICNERKYFWEYDGICLRDMRHEDYLKMHEMVYDTDACVLFDSDVKLPYIEKELSESEKSHLQFGGSGDRIEFAITDKEGNFVGNINLCGIDSKNGKFSYSVYVLREHRGKRYAQKALHLLLYYAFEELRMHKLITCVNMGNGPSAGMMRNAGCVVEGVLRDNMFYHGKYIDTVVMGLTEEEFREKMWNRNR